MIELIATRKNRTPQLLSLLGLLVLPSSARAQDHVTWRAELTPPTLQPGKAGIIRLTAKIDDTWHIYAPSTPPGGPFATQIKLVPDKLLSQAGKISQPKPIRQKDESFGIETETFEESVTFGIPIKLKANAKSSISQIQVVFQSCSSRVCLPPRTLRVPVTVKVVSKK